MSRPLSREQRLDLFRRFVLTNAEALGIDPATVKVPRPGVVSATSDRGDLVLHVAVETYGMSR